MLEALNDAETAAASEDSAAAPEANPEIQVSLWDTLPIELKEPIVTFVRKHCAHERQAKSLLSNKIKTCFGPLHKELLDYVTLKNICGRSGIRVVAPPVYEWNLVNGIYCLEEMVGV